MNLRIALIMTILMAMFVNANVSVGIHNIASLDQPSLSPTALASPIATVYVSPQNNTYNLDEVFTINVTVANVTDFYGVDIVFAWDPAILEYVNHTATIPIEDFPGGILHEPVMPIVDSVNATAGTYQVAKASMDPAPAFTGTGTAFNMTFRVKSTSGACLLDIVSVELSDIHGTVMPKQIIDGLFSPVGAPEAVFTWWPNTGVVNKPVIFNASESHDPDGVANYYWNFGDGNKTTTTDPVIEHSFTYNVSLIDTFTYTVSLIVEDTTHTNSSAIQHQVTIVKSRNIEIDSLSLTVQYQILVNSTLYVNVTVANEGYVNENTTLTAYYNTSLSDWSLIASTDIVNLARGYPKALSIEWNTTGVVPDEYYAVKANVTAVPYENETDNTRTSKPIYITSVVLHDMVADQLTVMAFHGGTNFPTLPIILGEDAAFTIVVANNGTVSEANFDVILYGNGTVINQWNINETLQVGFTTTFRYTWTGIDLIGDYNITLQVIVDNDAHLANNNLERGVKVVDTPLLNITYAPEPAIVNQTVTLDASGSVDEDPGGQIVSYLWDIYQPGVTPGIGVSTARLNGTVVSYNFTMEGNWTIVLTVTDNYGLTYDARRSLTSDYRFQMPIAVQTSGGGGGGFPIEYIVIPLVIVVVILVIALIYWRRKGTKPASS
jgi:hypothetical protein